VRYTHYDYLDLPPGATPAQIETAYVGLLERFGYGTTTDAGQDMSGLVTMIHAAHEALANPEARNSYDAALAREAAMADAELKATLDQPATGARNDDRDSSAWLGDAGAVIAA
jgi:DnaJ-class molecular chaperone